MVRRMSEPYKDPSGNTEAFQSFVRREAESQPTTAAPKRSRAGLIIGIAVVVIIVAAVVWLALS